MNDNMPQVKVCRNCNGPWREGDKYCRYCGAPLTNPGYKIEEFYTIYGPRPVGRRHVCSNCGYMWETVLMIDRERFCPRCGAEASTEEAGTDAPYAKRGFFDRLFGKEK